LQKHFCGNLATNNVVQFNEIPSSYFKRYAGNSNCETKIAISTFYVLFCSQQIIVAESLCKETESNVNPFRNKLTRKAVGLNRDSDDNSNRNSAECNACSVRVNGVLARDLGTWMVVSWQHIGISSHLSTIDTSLPQ